MEPSGSGLIRWLDHFRWRHFHTWRDVRLESAHRSPADVDYPQAARAVSCASDSRGLHFNSPSGTPTWTLWLNGKDLSRGNRRRRRLSCIRYPNQRGPRAETPAEGQKDRGCGGLRRLNLPRIGDYPTSPQPISLEKRAPSFATSAKASQRNSVCGNFPSPPNKRPARNPKRYLFRLRMGTRGRAALCKPSSQRSYRRRSTFSPIGRSSKRWHATLLRQEPLKMARSNS